MSESHLLQAARAGVSPARSLLLQQASPILLHLAAVEINKRTLAGRVRPSDLVQDTLAAAMKDLPAFRGRTIPVFHAWLAAILRNRLRAVARKEAPQTTDRVDMISDISLEPPEEAHQRATLQLLTDARQSLDPEERRVLDLYDAGKSCLEIAAILNCSAAAARKRLERARKAWHEAAKNAIE